MIKLAIEKETEVLISTNFKNKIAMAAGDNFLMINLPKFKLKCHLQLRNSMFMLNILSNGNLGFVLNIEIDIRAPLPEE